MSMPNDFHPDLAEAARAARRVTQAAGSPRGREARRSLLRRLSPEQYGFASAILVAFLGVSILGPKLREFRKPRHRRLVDRVGRATDRALDRARRQARDLQDEAARRAKRLGEALPVRR